MSLLDTLFPSTFGTVKLRGAFGGGYYLLENYRRYCEACVEDLKSDLEGLEDASIKDRSEYCMDLIDTILTSLRHSVTYTLTHSPDDAGAIGHIADVHEEFAPFMMALSKQYLIEMMDRATDGALSLVEAKKTIPQLSGKWGGNA